MAAVWLFVVLNAVNAVNMDSRTCQAGVSTAQDCAIPMPLKDGQPDPAARVIRLLNLEGEEIQESSQIRDAVDYSQRAEYKIVYDSVLGQSDFLLVLEDTVAPVLNLGAGADYTMESIGGLWPLPRTNATDNIDGDISDEVAISISFCAKSQVPCDTPTIVGSSIIQGDNVASNDLNLKLDSFQLGQYQLNYTIADHAGLFGRDTENNVATATSVINLVDTSPPTLYCNKQTCALASGAAVKEELFEEHLLETTEGVLTADICCTLCEKNNFNWQESTAALPTTTRETNSSPQHHQHSTNTTSNSTHSTTITTNTTSSSSTTTTTTRTGTEPVICGFFSFLEDSNTCHMFKSTLETLKGNVVPDAQATAGFPIGCQVQNVHECGTSYTDPGAHCIDTHDSWTSFGVDMEAMSTKVQHSGTVQYNSPGVNQIQYTCADDFGNDAAAIKRYIDVVDTTPPELSIVNSGSKYTSLLSVQRSVLEDSPVTINAMLGTMTSSHNCTDSCPSSTQPTVTTEWTLNGVDVPHLDWSIVGNYVLKYTCTDSKGNEVSKVRTVVNQHANKPVLNPNGMSVVVYTDGRHGEYHDAHATCKSLTDGQIDDKIQVSGHIVDVTVPGTYFVNYDCTDSAGHRADTATRTVIVQDDACPVCEVVGGKTLTLEAGFAWNDPKAHCSTAQGIVALSTVATGVVDMFVPGSYLVTYTATDAKGYSNDGEHCVGPTAATRTVTVVDTMEPLIPLSDAECAGCVECSACSECPHCSVPVIRLSDSMTATLPWSEGGSLMAEEVGPMNSWAIAAAVCAVAGLALLGVSSRSKSASASVPV